MRDYQRTKVYRWQWDYIDPFMSGFTMNEDEIADFVNFVWANEGRNHPPKVIIANGMVNANATRFRLKFAPGMMKMRTVIHELAHALAWDVGDEDVDDKSHEHGPVFVRKYVDLLEKYAKVPRLMMEWSLKETGVDIS